MSYSDADLQKFANSVSVAEEKFVSFLKIALPYIVLFFSVLVTVMRSLFALGLSAISAEFWINLATNILTTMTTYAVFCSHGADSFKKLDTGYHTNLALWARYSNFIRTKMPSEFSTYCQEYAKKVVASIRRERVEAKTLISWEEYLEKYAKLTPSQLEGYKNRGEITKDEYRAFLKARGEVKTPRLNATSILCGSGSVSVENIPKAKTSYVIRAIGARPFVMLILSAGWAIITPTFLGLPVATVIFSVIFSCFMLIFSAVMGTITGNYGARRDAYDVKTRIFFCETFLVEKGKMEEV